MKYFAIALFLGLVALVCASDSTEDSRNVVLENYCEMVRIHKASREVPPAGWPDFKGIYDTECKGAQ